MVTGETRLGLGSSAPGAALPLFPAHRVSARQLEKLSLGLSRAGECLALPAVPPAVWFPASCRLLEMEILSPCHPLQAQGTGTCF
jgi:hypothetical protein